MHAACSLAKVEVLPAPTFSPLQLVSTSLFSAALNREINFLMSANMIEAKQAADCCAACGKAEIDDVKLKPCPHCDLVHYCSDECQQGHRTKHKKDCKKRAAELRDELLFKQPESNHFGDCPICFLPMPLDLFETTMFHCCSKQCCKGCHHATCSIAVNDLAERTTARSFEEELATMRETCPFCREPRPGNECELITQIEARAEVNDPVALCLLGEVHSQKGDHENAVKYWLRAAELGEAGAHYNLSCYYCQRTGVEEDKKLMFNHLEEAAILGLPQARHSLACYEWEDGKYDRAVLHWIIAANLGHRESIKALTTSYKDGHLSKEAFAVALRTHQAAIDEMKSPQREKAKAFFEWNKKTENLC